MAEEIITEAEAREFLEERHKDGKRIIEALEIRTGLAEGIKRLLTQLYPDKAHFIYELLQNAEDARATHVSFKLERDKLVFHHDGRRFFTKQNVDAITSIDSTKANEVNQIGKFGVGFKAVFSYTSRPQIYSGPFRFEIRDLFCPYPLYSDPLPLGLDSSQTYFVFPFPGEKKTLEACFDETAEGLNALDERALLFLNSIETISWKIDGAGDGLLARGQSEGNIVTIEKCSGEHNLPESFWLKFDQDLRGSKGTSLRCSIAYALKPKEAEIGQSEKGKLLGDKWEVVPVDGQAHIYFPAIKETTGLQFHVHAPFGAPVDRASVTDNRGNRELVEDIGQLVAKSLTTIKSIGLLDRSFLRVLPNEEDGIPEFWDPIFRCTIEAFRSDDLLPTNDKRFVRSSLAILGNAELRELISNEDLRFLVDDATVSWAIGVFKNTRESDFLDSLELLEFSSEELVKAIGQNLKGASIPKLKAGKEWLGRKEVKWLGLFYAVLDKAFDLTKYDPDLKNELSESSIIRLADGTFTSGTTHPYFSPTIRLPQGLQFPHVEESVFDDKKPKQAESARSFLRKVGVKEVNDDEVVKTLISNFYHKGAVVPPDDHLQHIKLFLEWATKEKSYHAFKEAKLFLNSDGHLSDTETLFLDTPFGSTGLNELFGSNWKHKWPRRPVSPIYANELAVPTFAKFAEQVGVISKLRIDCYPLTDTNPEYNRLYHRWGNIRRTDTEHSQEFWIVNVDVWLKNPTLKSSLQIWDTMAAASPETFKARYRPNASNAYLEAPSLLMIWLKTTPWIPDRSGEFKLPADLSKETLHPDFQFEEGDGWLTKIGFGENVRRATQDYRDKVKALSDIGLPPKLADKLLGLNAADRGELLCKWESDLEKTVQFPERPVQDVSRRSSRVAQQVRSAPVRTSETRDREVRVTKGAVDARTWLREQYTNESGLMFCQMQDSAPKVLPFKYPDENGKFYFVACEFLGDLKVELLSNYLSLSPDCEAEFKHACLLTDDEKRKRLLAIDPNGSPETLCLELDTPVHKRLRFTQAHLVDLQTAIRTLA
jgi:hypothetical protein